MADDYTQAMKNDRLMKVHQKIMSATVPYGSWVLRKG